MKKIILTAFEPFGDNDINPTIDILNNIPDVINNIKIIKKILPVVYDKCFDLLEPIIKKEKPDYVIGMGLAGGRKNICIERIAVNMKSASIADNEGNMYKGEVITKKGIVGYFTNLPYEQLITVDKKIDYSFSAGTYICNNLFYLVMEYVNNKDIKGGFIHVPYSEIFNKEPFISISKQSDIIRKMIIKLGEV